MTYCNEKIRKAAREKGIYLWRVAQRLGVCEMTLTRLLRVPIPEAKEQEILAIINDLAREDAFALMSSVEEKEGNEWAKN